ncbi:MAG: hypothetical protein P8178_10525, partial [Candidatus Thiodiazotropha sp.]
MIRPIAIILMTLALWGDLYARDFGVDVPMHLKGASTFYIQGRIGSMPPTEFMVDTGSSYMTINEETLASLRETEEP